MHRVRRVFELLFPKPQDILLALLVCVLLPISLVSLHVAKNPELSPIDEAAHYDYVERAAAGNIPRLGQLMTAPTLRLISCRGTALNGLIAPPCSQRILIPSTYPGEGYSYEAQQPPVYYFASVALAWLPQHLLGISNFTATRLTGAAWLVLALLMFWAAARLFSVPAWKTGLGCLLLGVAPVSVYYSSIVTNDASDLFCGSLILLLGALYLKKRLPWASFVFFAVALILPALKATDILPIIVMSAFLFVLDISSNWNRKDWRLSLSATVKTWLPSGGLLALGGTLSVLVWTVVQRNISLVNPKLLAPFAALRGTTVTISSIASEALSMFNPLAGAFSPLLTTASAKPLGNPTALNLEQIFATGLLYLLVAGGLAAFFVTPRRWEHWLGLLTLAGLFAGGVVLGYSIWKTYNADPGLSGRYGLSLAPFLVLGLIELLRGRWVTLTTWLFAASGLVLDFWLMLVR